MLPNKNKLAKNYKKRSYTSLFSFQVSHKHCRKYIQSEQHQLLRIYSMLVCLFVCVCLCVLATAYYTVQQTTIVSANISVNVKMMSDSLQLILCLNLCTIAFFIFNQLFLLMQSGDFFNLLVSVLVCHYPYFIINVCMSFLLELVVCMF